MNRFTYIPFTMDIGCWMMASFADYKFTFYSNFTGLFYFFTLHFISHARNSSIHMLKLVYCFLFSSNKFSLVFSLLLFASLQYFKCHNKHTHTHTRRLWATTMLMWYYLIADVRYVVHCGSFLCDRSCFVFFFFFAVA